MLNLQFIPLNWVDYTIIGVVVFSTLISLMRGFVKEFVSLLTWVIAFWIALRFNDKLTILLAGYIKNHILCVLTSYAVLFVSVLILGALINFFISMLIMRTGLSSTDRALGMVFGLTRGVLLVSVLLLLASSLNFSQSSFWQRSLLAPNFQGTVTWLRGFLPQKVEHLSTMMITQETKIE